MYVVAGVGGNTGSVVADTLLAQGKPVTVIVRSEQKGRAWASRGAQVAVASLNDSNAMTGVLKGAEGAYLLTPPNLGAPDFLAERRAIAQSIAHAVQDSGVEHAVFLSSVGAQHASGTGPIVSAHIGESALEAAAKNLTIIRAAFFLENWAPLVPVAKQNGVLPTLLTHDRKIPMVATKDVGNVAAESLLNPPQGRRIVELAGAEDYSPDEIASVLSLLLDRDIRVEAVPLSAGVEMFQSFGFSEQMARLFQEMYASLNSGLIDFEHKGSMIRRGAVTAAQALRAMLQQPAHMQAGA